MNAPSTPAAFTIRPAVEADLPALLDIFNHVIVNSTAVWMLAPVTLDERRAWFDARRKAGYPVLAADDGSGTLVGFASFGDFRGPSAGYRHSVEHSVHVRAECRGQGIGSALIEALFPPAAALGKHVMVGGIDAANTGSIRLHERLGFERVALMREVGHKFGRWLDLVLMQRFVDPPGAARLG